MSTPYRTSSAGRQAIPSAWGGHRPHRGRLYAHGPWFFYCGTIARHPDTGEQTALGWIRLADSGWSTHPLTAAEWTSGWEDVTPAPSVNSAAAGIPAGAE
ncbi:hypothetical protein [Streptomyces sp. CAU 1734]|uniref:hypothetical protein n=1 Tax=Streptomyces sp. CAU 1734 TaxID=3140360 RepID=UPI003260E40E